VRVRSLGYPARIAHAQYYSVICGLSGSTTFNHIISYKCKDRRLWNKIVKQAKTHQGL